MRVINPYKFRCNIYTVIHNPRGGSLCEYVPLCLTEIPPQLEGKKYENRLPQNKTVWETPLELFVSRYYLLMPPGKQFLPQSIPSQPPAPPPVLLCWPICKYSYSITPTSSRSQSPWLHFAQRDNIYLVLETSQPDDVFDHLGAQTRMKIVWGAQTLASWSLPSYRGEL